MYSDLMQRKGMQYQLYVYIYIDDGVLFIFRFEAVCAIVWGIIDWCR